MIKAVLFDFDGVMTLDETGSQSICNYVCARTGLDYNVFSRAYRKHNPELLSGTITHEDVWDEICRDAGMSIDIEILRDSFVNTPINNEMLSIVKKMKANNYKTGMVTDNKADRIRSVIKHNGWEDLFDCVAVSAEIGSGKSGEKIFNAVFEKLSMRPSECVFIDNDEKNLIAPGNMGVAVIFYDYNENESAGLLNKLIELGIKL